VNEWQEGGFEPALQKNFGGEPPIGNATSSDHLFLNDSGEIALHLLLSLLASPRQIPLVDRLELVDPVIEIAIPVK
jgi:hypothetical protein